MASSRDIEAVLVLKDKISSQLQTANKNLKDLNKQVVRNQKELEKVQKNTSFLSLAKGIIGAQVAMRAASAAFRELGQFVTGSVRASSEFNDAFTKSTAIMGDLADTMKTEMVSAAVEVSKTTTFSATQAAEAYFFLASAGLNAAQSIGALPQVAAFAQAGSFDLARATDLLTDAQSALGYSSTDTAENMKQMARVSDVLVLANVKANASVEQFATALTQKGATALRTVNKSLEEGVAVLAVWANQGIKGEQAGTALNRVILDLTSKANKNAAAFKKNNIAVFDSTGTMRNMADIVQDLEKRMGGMSDQQKKATFQMLGFADKSSVYISSLIGQSEAIREYEAAAKEASGFTDEVAAKQLESYASQVTLAEHAWENLQRTLGDFITENKGILALIRGTTDLMNRLTESITENEKAWTDAAGRGLDLFIGAIDAVVTSTGLLVTGLGKIIQAAASLQETLGFLSMTSERERAVNQDLADGMVAFGEAALRASAEIDILQEKIKFAADNQSFAIDITDKHTEALLDTQRALAKLSDTDLSIYIGLRDKGLSAAEALEKLASAAEKAAPAIDNLGGGVDGLASVAIPSLEGALDRLYGSIVPVKEEMIFLGSVGLAPAVAGFGDLEDAILNAEREFIPAKEGIGDVSAAMAAAVPVTVSWTEVTGNLTGIMGDAGNILSVFGVEVDSTIGKITRLISSFESLFSNVTSLIGAFGGGGGGGGGLGSLLGGLFGGGGKSAGLPSPGSFMPQMTGMGATAGTGFLSGFGSTVGGGMSSLAATLAPLFTNPFTIAIGAILGGWLGLKALFGGPSTFESVGEEAARDFGMTFSESLQHHIVNLAEDVFGGDRAAAMQAALASIIREGLGDGFDSSELDMYTEKIADTFSFIERGQLSATEGQKILNDAFAQLIPHLDELGAEGVAELERILAASDRLGIEFKGQEAAIQSVIDYYNELGIKVPPWIEEIAASLGLVEGELYEATKGAGKFTDSLNKIPRNVSVTIRETIERVSKGGGDGGIPGLQHGGWAPKAPTPFGQLYRLGEREPELVIPQSKVGQVPAAGGGLGATVNVTIAPTIVVSEPLASPEDIERAVVPVVVQAIKNDVDSIVGEIGRALGHS